MILSHVSCPNKFSGVARTFGRSDLGLGEVHLNFVPSLLLFKNDTRLIECNLKCASCGTTVPSLQVYIAICRMSY